MISFAGDQENQNLAYLKTETAVFMDLFKTLTNITVSMVTNDYQ